MTLCMAVCEKHTLRSLPNLTKAEKPMWPTITWGAGTQLSGWGQRVIESRSGFSLFTVSQALFSQSYNDEVNENKYIQETGESVAEGFSFAFSKSKAKPANPLLRFFFFVYLLFFLFRSCFTFFLFLLSLFVSPSHTYFRTHRKKKKNLLKPTSI